MTTRRDFLRIGASVMGLDLPRLLAAAGPAQNCILYFQEGGACQHDSFDPKPEQPAEIRGSWKTIPTAIPGVHFSELLPLCAKNAKKFAVIRSMYSREAIHEKAKQYVFSGSRPNNAFKHPVYGSVVAKELGPRNGLPPFVCIPRRDICADAGFLGAAYDPFITGDPGKKEFKVQDLSLPGNVSLEESASRARLLRAMDEELREAEKSKVIEGMDYFYQKAFDLVTSEAARKAFDIEAEPAKLRDQYGRNSAGQGALLARRLIESGVRLAAVFQGGYDSHGGIEKSSKSIFPVFDQAFSTLLEDLEQRGLLESTLVLAIGEFGRTPHINHSAGRDHWPGVFSIAAAGAGIEGGQVIGSSDAQGGAPKDRPISIEDLGATIYKKLGMEPHKEYRSNGRPVKMNDGGVPIRELF
ncbi:MAG: DUF1501 domain-containing protein [Acidobacteria bacterium]|nr:DUF1501 domain-containing protein [Acidobacteriota bacterium]